jgi:hypothetical protein
MYSTDNLGFIRAAADDGIHNGEDIATNFTSRRQAMKNIIERFKMNLMEFFDEYDFDRLLADALVFCAVLLAGAFMVYFVLENYGGL